MRLYLASTSPARRALLAQSGIEPVLVSPGVDEDAVGAAAAASLGRALTGPELVSLLAVAKASAVADSAVAGSPAVAEAVTRAESELGDTGRVLLRPSGTEQLVRVMVEAPTAETADAVAGTLAEVVAGVR